VKVAFVGATRGIGRALARALAERGDALFLLGRDAAEMALSARDLEARRSISAGRPGSRRRSTPPTAPWAAWTPSW
jgi:short-subunit dehydrogenase